MGGPPLKSMDISFDISTLTVHQTLRNQCNIYSYHSLSYHGMRKKKRQRCMLAPDSYVMHASPFGFPTVNLVTLVKKSLQWQ